MKNKFKIFLLIFLVILTAGCTKSLKDSETKKVVINPITGQSLTKNILCQPTDKDIINIKILLI